MPKVLKAASIRQNRDEYRAHSAHLDACRTQTKTGIITFTLTERDEQLPSYKYVRLWSQYVMSDKRHGKNQPLDEHGQVAEGSPLQQQTQLWPAKKNPAEQTNVQQHQDLLKEWDQSRSPTVCQRLSSGQFIHYSFWLTLFCHTCNWSPSPSPFSKIQVSHKWQMLLQFKRPEQEHVPQCTILLQNTSFLLFYSDMFMKKLYGADRTTCGLAKKENLRVARAGRKKSLEGRPTRKTLMGHPGEPAGSYLLHYP